MIIGTELQNHPRVAAALDTAGAIVGNWARTNDRETARADYWSGVALVESIAAAILDAEGFDLEGLEMMVTYLRPCETAADAMASFDLGGYDDRCG